MTIYVANNQNWKKNIVIFGILLNLTNPRLFRPLRPKSLPKRRAKKKTSLLITSVYTCEAIFKSICLLCVVPMNGVWWPRQVYSYDDTACACYGCVFTAKQWFQISNWLVIHSFLSSCVRSQLIKISKATTERKKKHFHSKSVSVSIYLAFNYLLSENIFTYTPTISVSSVKLLRFHPLSLSSSTRWIQRVCMFCLFSFTVQFTFHNFILCFVILL